MEFRTEYEKWCTDPYFDEATKAELKAIAGDDKEIEDRFYRTLEFGTAGLRGVIGAGTNRMNIYTVRQATQGLANYILSQGNFVRMLENSDRNVRKQAFETYYRVYDQFKNSIAAMYQANVKQAKFYADARHYASSLEMALDGSRIPTAIFIIRRHDMNIEITLWLSSATLSR